MAALDRAAESRRYYAANREKILEKQKRYRIENAERVAAYARENGTHQRRKSKYGISRDQFLEMLQAQVGGCAICGTALDEKSGRVDHDHSCCGAQRACQSCIRSILCDFCNQGIGFFREQPELLTVGIAYLESYK